mgnify:CR=1 FL=1
MAYSLEDIKRQQEIVRQQGWSEDEIAYGTMVEINRLKASRRSEVSDEVVVNKPKPKKSVGGFIKNVGRDVGEIVSGISRLPSTLIKAGKEGRLGELGGAVVKGTVEEYGQLLKQPGEFAYEKPVSAALDVIPFIKPLKALAGVGKAGKVAKMAGKVGEISTKIKATIPKLPKIEVAPRLWATAFKVPAPLAREIKPLEIAKEMLLHKRPITSVEGWGQFADQVTGKTGLVNEVVSKATGKIKGFAKVDNWGQGIDELAANGDIVPDVVNALEREIGRQIPVAAVTKKGARIPFGSAEPEAVIKSVRKLEGIASNYFRKSSRNLADRTVKGITINNLESAKAYQRVARTLMDNLQEVADVEGVVKSTITPEVIGRAMNLSKRLGEQLMNADSIRTLRSIQKPFVDLKKMVIETTAQMQTPTASSGARMIERAIAPVGGYALGGIYGLAAGMVLGPTFEAGIEAMRPYLTQAGIKIGGVAEKVGKAPFQLASKMAIGTGRGGQAAQAAQFIGRQIPSPSEIEFPQTQAEEFPTVKSPEEFLFEEKTPGLTLEDELGGMPTEEQMKKAYMLAIMDGNKKAADLLKSAISTVYGQQKLNATMKMREAQGKSGLATLAIIERKLKVDEKGIPTDLSISKKMSGVRKWFDPAFDAALFNTIEQLLRLNSGAAVPESEVRRYMQNYGPQIQDDEESMAQKLQTIKYNLQLQMSSPPPNTSQQQFPASPAEINFNEYQSLNE